MVTPANRAVFIPGRKHDWDWAKLQWETTDKSAPTIAIEIGCNPATLISRASSGGWLRGDPAQRTAEAAARLLLAERDAKNDRRRQELEAIERVNVAMQAEVLSTHRKDIKAARTICTKLLAQLVDARSMDADPASLEELASKSTVMLKLSNSLKNVILLERQALGISTTLMDPETEDAAARTPEAAALDLLVNKFASVLQAQQPQPIVVDVSSASPSNTATIN